MLQNLHHPGVVNLEQMFETPERVCVACCMFEWKNRSGREERKGGGGNGEMRIRNGEGKGKRTEHLTEIMCL